MPIVESVGRRSDNNDGHLLVQREDDGDILVTVMQESQLGPPTRATIEFCTNQGGGKSRRVRHALRALIKAIKEENELDPLRASDNWLKP